MESLNNQDARIGQQNINSIVHNYFRNKNPEKFLNASAIVIPETYIRRETELADITRRLETQKSPLVLINGEGGIGKTTTAFSYWKENESSYKHLAFFNGDEPPLNQFTNLVYRLELDAIPDNVPHFELVKTILQNLSQKCLLLIDNANDKTQLKEFLDKIRGLDWDIIITTRCTGVSENEYTINHLPEEKATELFKKYYDEETKEFDRQLSSFLKSVGYNTLVLELYAKFLKEASDWGETLSSVMQKLNERGIIIDGDAVDIKTEWSLNTSYSGNITLDGILDALYDFSSLSEELSFLLTQLAVAGVTTITFQDLKELLNPNSVKDLKKQLNELENKGWIAKTEKTYKLSQVVQLLILQKNNTSVVNIVQMLADRLAKLLIFQDHTSESLEKLKWLPYVRTVIQKDNGVDLAELFNQVAMVLKALGGGNNLQEAKGLLERALELNIKSFGENGPTVSTVKSNLALVLRDLGGGKNLMDAKELSEQALQSEIRNFGENSSTIAVTMSNLAVILRTLGGLMNLMDAKLLLEKALFIDVKNFGENSVEVAKRRANLAMVLIDLGGIMNINEAKNHLEKSLESSIKELEEESQMVTILKSNLAMALMSIGGEVNLKEAKELLKQALLSNIENLGEDAQDVALYRSKLALVLKDLGGEENLHEAKKLVEQALVSDIKNYGEDALLVAESKSNLAVILRELGGERELHKAKDLFEQALVSYIKNYGEDAPSLVIKRSNLAVVLKALGGRENLILAKEHLYLALGSCFKNFGEDSQEFALISSNMASTLTALGGEENLKTATLAIRLSFAIYVSSLGFSHPNSQMTLDNALYIYSEICKISIPDIISNELEFDKFLKWLKPNPSPSFPPSLPRAQ